VSTGASTAAAGVTDRSAYRRLLSAAFILACVVVLGATAYYQIGDGRWSFFDCVYMTVITLSTVGFAETLEGMDAIPQARVLTLGLIVVGSGTLLYFLSNLTALVVEGDLRGILRARRMQKRIDHLENHIVVCGAGNTGEHVIGELVDAGVSFVVIDKDEARVRVIGDDLGTELLHVAGDATDDHTLERAGVVRARGVIAALTTDKDNLFITISVRHLNPNARIVAKAIDSTTTPKLRRAGAHAIVSPNYIGGLRLVSEMIRPQAVQFLDRLLREDNKLRIEDVEIPATANVVGHTLAECSIRQTGALVIAIRTADGKYVYNPGPDVTLDAGSHLIVIAHAEDLARLREAMLDNRLLRCS